MRRTRRTIIGLALGVLAGAGFVLVPGLLAQTSSTSNPGPLPPATFGANYQRLLGPANAGESSLALILGTVFLIFLSAIGISMLTRNLTIKKLGGRLSEEESRFEESNLS